MSISRRDFLGLCTLASAGLFPVRFCPAPLAVGPGLALEGGADSAPFDDRLHPHYHSEPPLDRLIRKLRPSFDDFPSERYADEIKAVLARWSADLANAPPSTQAVAASLAERFVGPLLKPSEEVRLRSDFGVETLRRRFAGQPTLPRESFVQALSSLLSPMQTLLAAEFEITGIRVSTSVPPVIRTRVRYDLVGSNSRSFREERVGYWELDWQRVASGELQVREWRATEEAVSRAAGPAFLDVTSAALGSNRSYARQLLRGTDYWRTLLDAASGIDVYGNNGIAVGDIDSDGFDDLYVCQPAGLPNRLYRNRGDGTFEDVTDVAGVGVLDSTACALFADFDNDGRQDLLVVCSPGPLLFVNPGDGKFRIKPDAFHFAHPPQGTFTGAAVSDYDRDGRLDVYFCVYAYYQGLDQYRFPVPYHDAQNGPPNFLFRNEGDGRFEDVTTRSRMNQNNNRFSFACGWCDYNNDGWPDLYVANDFGKKNLYRNNGDGTFSDVAAELGVEDAGAGMSVCWFDYDNDGHQDLYVADMWSAAGLRITEQEGFQKDAPAAVRAMYRKHASGNSLLHNEGGGRFQDKSAPAGVEVGRWAWSSDAWDFDHDGYPDLYVANGFISGPETYDASGFFWREVVSHSPLDSSVSHDYEQGWNAINELIRSDHSWSGYERNNFFVNNRDGTFSEAAGALGLDFSDDARAFALADFDHDGRLEIALKNRTAPQLRILRNVIKDLGDAVAFRLRGRKSNRDAIGAVIAVETAKGRQTKFLAAGSGFLSQHTRELFFGLGKGTGPVRAAVRWPSGATQDFDNVPANHRIEIEEGNERFTATPFAVPPQSWVARPAEPAPSAAESPTSETWLIEPLPAPDFILPDLLERSRKLSQLRGATVLLNFWAIGSPLCERELRLLESRKSAWAARGLRLLTINVNDRDDVEKVRSFVRENALSIPVLIASEEVAGIYNTVYRYLFDRRRDLAIPTSFLLGREGLIVKIYQGALDPAHVEADSRSMPRTREELIKKALPFPDRFYNPSSARNHFTYGIAFLQRGYLNQALDSFRLVVQENPNYAESHYNLGTLYFKLQRANEAREHLERALDLKPQYPDALNNLGLLAAAAGRVADAHRYFEEAIRQNPRYTIALENLANLLRREDRLDEARQLLEQALRLDPGDPEANYSLGMVFAQADNTEKASEYLEKAVKLRPEYPEALNNLGVVYLRTRRLQQAIASFRECIRISPDFDQPYLNLARLYSAAGQSAKARQVLRQLLERKPNHALARQLLEGPL